MKAIVLACLMLLVSCGRISEPAALACPVVEGIEQVLAAPGVFIGDMHGSNQSPAFLGALACHAMKSGGHVVVAMEYNAQDQPVLDRFLNMADPDEAMDLLTSTPHWTGNTDGRASTAMANALHAMHGYRRTGGQLKLVAYDFWGADGQLRDQASADFLRELRIQMRDAEAYWILFGGNVHARKTMGLPFRNAPPGSEDHQPLGYLLRDWGLIHLNAIYRGGESWGCIDGTCSVHDLGPPCPTGCTPHPVIRLHDADPAYDGVYDVGMLSVSRPLHWR